VETNNNDSNQM